MTLDFPCHKHEEKTLSVCHRRWWLFICSFPSLQIPFCLWFQVESCLQSVFLNGSLSFLLAVTPMEQEAHVGLLNLCLQVPGLTLLHAELQLLPLLPIPQHLKTVCNWERFSDSWYPFLQQGLTPHSSFYSPVRKRDKGRNVGDLTSGKGRRKGCSQGGE